MNMKQFSLAMFLTLVLSIFSTAAIAQEVPDFVTVQEVQVNGVVASELSPVYLERGQLVNVEVFFTGNPLGRCTSGDTNPCYDTRLEVEIQGHENVEVRDVEGPFEVETGVGYRKVLSFSLPVDMPASDDLNLNLEFKDDDEVVLLAFPVRIQETRHGVNIFDVIFNPANNVQAGQPLFTTVRVENLGDNTENNVKVTVSVPALGLQTSEYIDRLTTMQDQNDEDDENADDAATTNDLLLMIPQNTPSGDYSVVVSVEYNRGFSLAQKTYTMHVASQAQPATTPGVQTTGVIVNIESEALRVNQGQGAVYRLTIANLGQQASTFNLELNGVQDWANTRVDPSLVVVQANGAQDVYVYVAPKEDVEGLKLFTVKVMSGSNKLAEEQLSLEVVKGEKATSAKTIFTWIFVVLLGILVILLIVMLAKRLG